MTGAAPRPLRLVALGGGHGLFASLSALRRLSTDVTAVVTVADDGGSSGRIRRELRVLPPGDLRMALAALAGRSEKDRAWAALYQHRFGGFGALAGHPVGNLVLTGLLEQMADPVEALAVAADSIGVVGRVLPMSCQPLDLVARVVTVDPDDPVRERVIRGQSAIASTPGRVRHIEVAPAEARACDQAVDAVRTADVVVLGPGSWFTSVIPHLLLTDLADALVETQAVVVVTMNLAPQPGETDGFSPSEHLRVLRHYAPALRPSAVVVDERDALELAGEARALGAQLVAADLRSRRADDRHDPIRLADAITRAMTFGGARADDTQRNDTQRNDTQRNDTQRDSTERDDTWVAGTAASRTVGDSSADRA